MTDTIIPIAVRVIEGKAFYAEGKNGLSEALQACQDANCEALFMPELALARINADKDSFLWKNYFSTPSLKATGRTRAGNAVVVYAHIPNYFSDPTNIRDAVKGDKLVNGAGIISQEDFYSLLKQEGNGRVFGVGDSALKDASSGIITIEDALKHPQTIPFLGGKEIAEKYLEKYQKIYGDRIGVWHTDDLQETPIGRLLFVANNNYGLYGSYYLDSDGCFVGVAQKAQTTEENSLEKRLQTLYSKK